ncbi:MULTISPECIES: hypothetical protein [Thermoactinomyces]|jgi:hypothetical protein|uniref:Uncharacterized protein n=1 Tax=Thermoactinomyces daqus TaxID=1329516 RepID=A0A7W1XCN6_9BACL|nr:MULTISPECIES: hypothetical protein [Thermoactinomyces]MBA4544235.1 hypothetical protein [Thermoactinomyces daqus]MBH8597035.1 hypothetical protein [Thermoactinomyces sp. CICC 10523]MBH8603812.1 hypothetical protein [Thermoactinomyces sp. CICC 10522]MBH8608868.1 hypothetical protein [Thermoactinomyces sp. CICC 10521]
MPNFFSFGFLSSNNIASSGSIGVGQNIIQNRNAMKNNSAARSVGIGFNNVPVIIYQNLDMDNIDQLATDFQNLGGGQL